MSQTSGILEVGTDERGEIVLNIPVCEQRDGWWHVTFSPQQAFDLALLLIKNTNIPLDQIIICPNCGKQHIDKPEPDICECGCHEDEHGPEQHGIHNHSHCRGDMRQCECREFVVAWNNPPHKSHLCLIEDGGCGTIWRPADVPTNGVAQIKTKGEKDTWTNELHGLCEFVRSLARIQFEEWYGNYQDGEFYIFDSDGNSVASGKDALEAIFEMNKLK